MLWCTATYVTRCCDPTVGHKYARKCIHCEDATCRLVSLPIHLARCAAPAIPTVSLLGDRCFSKVVAFSSKLQTLSMMRIPKRNLSIKSLDQ